MRKLMMMLCLVISIGWAAAQTRVTGTVVSTDDGQPIIGASVVVKGTSSGTITDADGKFALTIPANAKVLVFSYVGMKTVELAAKPSMQVQMQSDSRQISEIVVTAMGISRSSKSLGYAASTVKADELNRATPVSVTNGLTGKVAGLNISNSGGTGTSEKVIIRGFTSFNNNQPLYIVDGVPIQNSFMGSATTNQAVDFGNQAGDINPDDVASVTVLKGASATALYGSRAANGVILITTKRGATDSKLQVSYTGTATVSNVLRVPQYQTMFGQGWPLLNQAGTYEPGLQENGSWGPVLDGMMRTWGAPLNSQGIYTPVTSGGVQRVKPFAYVKNNLRDFYENGLELNNNISISAGNQNTSFVMTYNNVTSDGILPTNVDKYDRNTFYVRGDANFKKFHAKTDISYVRKDIRNVRGGQGGATGATTFQDLIQTPVDVPYLSMKNYNDPYNNTDNFYTAYAQNPYWIIANNQSVYQDDRVYGNVELSYDVTSGLKAVGRLGGDFTNSRQRAWAAQMIPASTSWVLLNGKSSVPGNYEEYNVNLNQLDATFMLNADYSLWKNFRVTGTAGWNLNQRGTYYIDAYQGSIDVPNWYNLSNGTALPTTTSSRSNRRLVGLFAQGDISYKDWAFLGISARNDWSSTLPKGKNSFFYGGVNGSVILTDAIKSLQNTPISYLKFRAGIGQTGNDADVYLTNSKFVPTQIALGFGNLYTPLNGVSGLTLSNTIYNQNLKPEISTEVEFGMDLRMLQNRIGLDLAWYNKNTKNQIIQANVAPESAYVYKVRNVGLINNQGIEARLYGSPLKNKDFEWEVGVTFAKNWSKAKELWDNVDRYLLTSAYDVYYVMLKGQAFGQFQVPKTLTVSDKTSPYYGKVIVNANGLPQVSSTEFTTIGSSTPDFTMGFTSTWKYKTLTLSVVLDYRQGGYFYSNTARMLDWNGNGTNTMFNARQPFLVPNSVKQLSSGGYAENDIPIMTTSVNNYWNYSTNNKGLESNCVLPKTYVKVREVTLTYAMPKKWFAKTPIKDAQISLIGRNLLMWTPAKNNFVDPDQSNYGNDVLSNFGEFSSAPTVRNLGASLKLNF
ncbi:MAG: SusC/RagA family TonB-linked outer membrane protein [Bacteroidota bacterium]|nr:SusC/RagA family TonB-linked outer membrane protein [Bacteroidota bacterium]